MSSSGITSFGAYIPRLRIDRSHIAKAHAWMAPSLRGAAKGERAFCSWDEDSITMAVEAGRDCLTNIDLKSIGRITLASTTAPFADLQGSAIAAGALRLEQNIASMDIASSQRAATSGFIQMLQSAQSTLFIASERPVAKPASPQELGFGAGAAAYVTGTENVIAEFLASATVTTNFVDHFRAAEEQYNYYWEERWIRNEGINKLVIKAATSALEKAGLGATEINHLIVPPVQRGTAKTVARQLGFEGNLADDLQLGCGYTGTAHPLLMLANVLEQAGPGEHILLIGFGQGADAIVLRTTEHLASRQPARGIKGNLADKLETGDYLRMLSFYQGIELEWGMRSEKSGKTMFSAQYRAVEQTAGFNAGLCSHCDTVQFPQLQYCVNTDCRKSAAEFETISLVDVPCEVFTYTSDWLSYHPAPPLNVGFVQFDNGARVLMEMVDIGNDGLAVGMPMRNVFRVKELDQERGYRRYFWKATPSVTKEA
ncbi:MAG: 3-oxoacyl-[acyl-carrier-protein] synthase III C-terminal domain-containing protein [Candidatus Rariloculaceae bacterium]